LLLDVVNIAGFRQAIRLSDLERETSRGTHAGQLQIPNYSIRSQLTESSSACPHWWFLHLLFEKKRRQKIGYPLRAGVMANKRNMYGDGMYQSLDDSSLFPAVGTQQRSF